MCRRPARPVIRALIVDDEPHAVRRIRDLLAEDNSIEVIGQASNGYRAMELIVEINPDLVFLDIQMPGLDGLEVLDRLKGRILPHIILVTGYGRPAASKAAEVFIEDCLLKPFTRKDFNEILAKAVKEIGLTKRTNGSSPL